MRVKRIRQKEKNSPFFFQNKRSVDLGVRSFCHAIVYKQIFIIIFSGSVLDFDLKIKT